MAYTQSTSLWDDADFLACSDGARITYQYLITGRHAEAAPPGLVVLGDLGAGAGGTALIAEALQRTPAEITAALDELVARMLIQVDRRLIRIRKGPWYKFPHNPKTVLGWYRRWMELPNSPLKFEHLMTMRLALVEHRVTESILAAWDERFGAEIAGWRSRDRSVAISAVIPGSAGDPGIACTDLSATASRSKNKPPSSSSSSDTVSIPYRYRSLGSGSSTTTTDLGSGSGIREGEREREGDAISATVATARDAADAPIPIALALYRAQETRRGQLGLMGVPFEPERIEAALSRYTPEQLAHALDVFHADAIRDGTKRKFFNGVTNWSMRALATTVGRPVEVGARPNVDGNEQYAGGEVL